MQNQVPKPLSLTFYPNECFICKSTKYLRRCSQCQMISYCGEIHQKVHWEKHRDLCKAISALMKQKGVSHLFENLRYVDENKWKEERENAEREVQMRLFRPLLPCEIQMFLFPRVCCVCLEAKQQNLRNCPSCPSASFCSQHKDSTGHSINCFLLKTTHDLELALDLQKFSTVLAFTTLVIDQIFFTCKDQTLPKSMKELLLDFPKPKPLVEIPDQLKVYASELLTIPLTLFNALQKAKLPSISELIVHVGGAVFQNDSPKFWEIILHLLPNLKFLKVVIVDDNRYTKMKSHLCDNCKFNNKEIQVETVSFSYKAYLSHETYEKPNMLIFYNVNPPNERELLTKIWKSSLLAWGSVSCPLVLTTVTAAKWQGINKILKSTFSRSMIHYDGLNDFSSLRPKREWEFGGMYRENQFMIILDVLNNDKNETIPELVNDSTEKKSSIQNKIEKKSNSVKNEPDLIDNKTEKKEPAQNKIENKSDSYQNKVENKSNSVKNVMKCKREIEELATEFFDDLGNWNYYYSNSCQVCHFNYKNVTCTRCKMVSYCEEKHRKEHWPEHKDLCKAILSTLGETGATTLFDKLKTDNMEAWVKVKIDVMLKIQKKLGRPLLIYEKQMFLFPKTCFICHESDLSVVKTCVCGLSICKLHKKDVRHNLLCNDFQQASMLAQTMFLIRPAPFSKMIVDDITKISIKTIPLQKQFKKLPSSIKGFISSNIKLSKEYIGVHGRYRVHLTAEYFSRPLTFLYAIQKLNLTSASYLNIHVIGVTNEEFKFADYWEVVLHWLPNLKKINIIFIGPEITKLLTSDIMICQFCKSMSKENSSVSTYPMKYHEYFESEYFSKPDVIIGYNLNLHESDLGISECTWKESIMTLKKLEAPFILTAETSERANKDHKKFCNLLEKLVPYDCCEENPFTSLIFERDFETEELKCPNKYIIIYKGLYEGSEKSSKLKEITIDQISEAIKSSQSKIKVVAKEINQAEKNRKKSSESLIDSSSEFKLDAEEKEKEKKSGSSETAELEKQFVEVKMKEEKKLVEVFELKCKSRIVIAGELEKQVAAVKSEKDKNESEGFQFKGNLDENIKVKEKDTNSESKVESKLEKNEFKQKLVSTESEEKLENVESQLKPENMEFEVKREKTESKSYLIIVENQEPVDKELSTENLLLNEKRLLKENQVLKEENEKLKNENIMLKQENCQLRTDNQLIKDIRSQVDKSVREAMSKNK